MNQENIFKYEGLIGDKTARPVTYDIRWNISSPGKQVVLFVHGFKGFKDWGIWNLIADTFAGNGLVFMKINLSHNGTSSANPEIFDDLEGFGNNNFTHEVKDIKNAVAAIRSGEIPLPEGLFPERINVIGHSRGGASVIIASLDTPTISKVITWASIEDVKSRYGVYEEEWEKKGVKYIPNTRTGQQMPLYYQLFKDIEKNKELFDIQSQLPKLKAPLLICHGSEDETVKVSSASLLKEAQPKAIVKIIEGANHVFGGSHPYDKTNLPVHAQELVTETINFIKL